MDASAQRLFWVDLQVTGTDPATCAIVEIATIITDAELQVVAEGPCRVIQVSDAELAAMSAAMRDLHARSGLLNEVRASPTSVGQAAADTVRFLEQHCVKGSAPMCGSAVWKDRAFLERHMPEVVAFLHYRIIDLSTIRELVGRWYPAQDRAPNPAEAHRARDELCKSIEELRWYRANTFVPAGTAVTTRLPM